MRNRKMLWLGCLLSLALPMCCPGQELKVNFNETGSHYLKFNFTNQVWLRYNQSNPGTTVLGEAAPHTFDISLRRTRLQFMGQVNDRMFVFSQLGLNNFNFLFGNGGNRKLHFFLHDAVGEYNVFKANRKLVLGGGLTVCNGLSRFTQISTTTLMALDLVSFAEVTIDQLDQFSRKFSVYGRGQVGRLDYRLALTDPFPITSSGNGYQPLGADATFAQKGHSHQYQGFLMWNFMEKESHVTPSMTGTYLGKKRILNLEAGAIFQPRAMWSLSGADTSFHDMLHWSVASFLDMPLGSASGSAVNAYLGYFSLDYGPNFLRNNGVMNPANGVVAANASYNGAGNAYPMYGTGSVLLGMFGYKFREGLLGELGTLMPYVSGHCSRLEKLDGPMILTNAGINWLMDGHNQKLGLDWQTRPVFNSDAIGRLVATDRKHCIVLQYQTAF